MFANALRARAKIASSTYITSTSTLPSSLSNCTLRVPFLSITNNTLPSTITSRTYSESAPRTNPPPSNTLILFDILESTENEVASLFKGIPVNDVRLFSTTPNDIAFIRFRNINVATRALKIATQLVFTGKARRADLLPPPNLKAHASVRILGLGLDSDGVKDLFKDFDVVNINIPEPAKESYAFVEFDSVNTALEAQEILRVQLVRHAFAKQKD
ncbi:hypothetical protein BDQ17DRAFT_1420091 [Cyathus striatus]|nr:hypothetical protein BDQ17DRAFT_1420091 [Cyathus striatus]